MRTSNNTRNIIYFYFVFVVNIFFLFFIFLLFLYLFKIINWLWRMEKLVFHTSCFFLSRLRKKKKNKWHICHVTQKINFEFSKTRVEAKIKSVIYIFLVEKLRVQDLPLLGITPKWLTLKRATRFIFYTHLIHYPMYLQVHLYCCYALETNQAKAIFWKWCQK